MPAAVAPKKHLTTDDFPKPKNWPGRHLDGMWMWWVEWGWGRFVANKASDYDKYRK